MKPPKTEWTVLLEWSGNRDQVQPLLEYIAGRRCDGAGSFLIADLSDMAWEFKTRPEARGIFERLKHAIAACRFSWYVRLQLWEYPPNLENIRDPRKVPSKRLAIYMRGKAPKFDIQPRRTHKSTKPKKTARAKQKSALGDLLKRER